MTGIALAAVVSLLAAPSPSKKIAVVASGQDAAASTLQRSLEAALARQGANLAATSEIAAALPSGREAAPATPAAEKAVADAQKAYFANDTVGAANALKTADDEIETHPEVAMTLRMRYFVTAIAVNLKLNRTTLADDAARQAVGLGAQKPPDLDDFPPAVAEFLDAYRTKMAQGQVARVKLEIATTPASATLTLDGVDREPTNRTFSLYPGKHVVSVRAPGYATVTQFVDTTQASVTIALPLRATFDVLFTRELSAGDRRAFEQIAQAVGAEKVVAASAQAGRFRAAVWSRSTGRFAPIEAQSAEALADEVLREMNRGDTVARATPAPTPTPGAAVRSTPSPRIGGSDDSDAGIQTETEAALAFANIGRSLKGSAREVYSITLNGSGPRLRVGVRSNGGLMADAEVTFLDILTTVDALDHANTMQHAKPGSFLTADLGAGYDFVRGERANVGAALVAGYEQFSTGDLPTDQVFSGWSAAHAGAEVRGAWDTGSVRFSLRAGAIAPLSWKETKANTSGQSPSASIAPRARLGALWHPNASGRMSFGAELGFEQRAVSFKGAPADTYFNSGVDAKANEQDLRGALVFHYAL